MRHMILGGLIAACGAASGSVHADDDAGAWYVSPMVQYHDLDAGRVAKDNFGGQVGVGYNLLHGFAIEADANRANFNISGSTMEQRLTGYSLDVIKKFFPESVIRPYVLAGVGEMDDTLTKSPRTYHTFLAEAGVGLLTGLGDQTGSTRVQLRTEAKYRMESASRGPYGPKDH